MINYISTVVPKKNLKKVARKIVLELFENFSDSSGLFDSLSLDSLFSNIFLELTDDLYLGLAGELDISEVTDSTFQGSFYSTLIKPAFHIPPHIVIINNGQFEFNKSLINLNNNDNHDLLDINKLELYPAYPNPFNPITTLHFNLEYNLGDKISLTIFDINGRKIESLINAPLSTGHHMTQWDASKKPSGVYIAKLQSKLNFQTIKLILVK